MTLRMIPHPTYIALTREGPDIQTHSCFTTSIFSHPLSMCLWEPLFLPGVLCSFFVPIPPLVCSLWAPFTQLLCLPSPVVIIPRNPPPAPLSFSEPHVCAEDWLCQATGQDSDHKEEYDTMSHLEQFSDKWQKRELVSAFSCNPWSSTVTLRVYHDSKLLHYLEWIALSTIPFTWGLLRLSSLHPLSTYPGYLPLSDWLH